MAWHGRTILETLTGGAKLTQEIATATGAVDVTACLRALRARRFITSAEGVHTITDAGRAALADNVKLTAGPCAGNSTSRKTRTLRDKTWSAIRQRDFFIVDDLLCLLLSEGESSNAGKNLRRYVAALAAAGYLLHKPGPFRGGPRRYRLRREMDTGPKAPAYNTATRVISDYNTGRRYSLDAASPACEVGV